MSRGLLDYVRENPYTEEQGELLPPAETEEKRLARKIKAGIEGGGIAREVLADCLSLIGVLSHNQAWADNLKRQLNRKEKPVTELDIPL